MRQERILHESLGKECRPEDTLTGLLASKTVREYISGVLNIKFVVIC